MSSEDNEVIYKIKTSIIEKLAIGLMNIRDATIYYDKDQLKMANAVIYNNSKKANDLLNILKSL